VATGGRRAVTSEPTYCAFCWRTADRQLARFPLCTPCWDVFWSVSEAFVDGWTDPSCAVCGETATRLLDGVGLCERHHAPAARGLRENLGALRTLDQIAALPTTTDEVGS
jgi:hypothetical protein